jgi:hypothetical protein
MPSPRFSQCEVRANKGLSLHTGDQGDGVLAAKLGGLEDVRVDRGEGCRLVSMWTWAARVGAGAWER